MLASSTNYNLGLAFNKKCIYTIANWIFITSVFPFKNDGTNLEGFLIPLTMKNVKAFLLQKNDPNCVKARFKSEAELDAINESKKSTN